MAAEEYNYSIEEVQKEEWNEGNVEAGKDASSAQCDGVIEAGKGEAEGGELEETKADHLGRRSGVEPEQIHDHVF